MNAGLEAALTEKQETEAKLLQAQQRIQQLEETIRYNISDFNYMIKYFLKNRTIP